MCVCFRAKTRKEVYVNPIQLAIRPSGVVLCVPGWRVFACPSLAPLRPTPPTKIVSISRATLPGRSKEHNGRAKTTGGTRRESVAVAPFPQYITGSPPLFELLKITCVRTSAASIASYRRSSSFALTLYGVFASSERPAHSSTRILATSSNERHGEATLFSRLGQGRRGFWGDPVSLLQGTVGRYEVAGQ